MYQCKKKEVRKISAHYVLVNSHYKKYAIISVIDEKVEVGESNSFYKEESKVEFYSGTLVIVDRKERKEIFHFQEINLQKTCFNLEEGIKIV